MGCDGWIPRPDEPFEWDIVCYKCGRAIVVLSRPIDGHEFCLTADGKLPIQIEQQNFDLR
jgi:hypothetical protein